MCGYIQEWMCGEERERETEAEVDGQHQGWLEGYCARTCKIGVTGQKCLSQQKKKGMMPMKTKKINY